MALSHKNSRLSLNKVAHSIDENTTFLAHYGVGTTESFFGIEPITSIVSPRYDGKFGSAIAIEDATINHIKNGDLSSYYSASGIGWDTELNGNLFLNDWGTGYNGGVPSPSIGYHAHINTSRFGYPVAEFIDMNSQFGHKHRWLGFSSQFTTNPSSLGWSANTKVTVSFDMMTDNPKKIIQTGIYRQLADNTYTFNDTLTSFRCETPYVWERKSVTHTLGNGWDTTKSTMLYLYGQYSDNDYEGIGWAKNIQVETKDFATSFVNGSRPKGQLSYRADCINPAEGTISFWYKPHYSPNPASQQQTSPMIFQVGGYHGIGSISIWDFTNSVRLFIRGADSTGWTATGGISTYPLKQNSWSMLTLTWKDKSFKLYVDGYLSLTLTSTTSLGSIANNMFFVGGTGASDGSGVVCNGTIDELRIDKVERTEEEIESWYLSDLPFLPKGTYGIAY